MKNKVICIKISENMCKRKGCYCNRKQRKNGKRKKRYQTGAGIFSNVRHRIANRIRSNALQPKTDGTKKGFDLHGKTLGVVNKVFGKRGMVPPPYQYLGPGNPLDQQLIRRGDKIMKYIVKPYNKLDQIASKHDAC